MLTYSNSGKGSATVAKKSARLQAGMPPESRTQAEQLLRQHLMKMPLHELRKRGYIHAMGGEQDIVATFPEGQITIDGPLS